MKKNILILTLLTSTSFASIFAQNKTQNILKTEADSIAYAYGVRTANSGILEYLKQLNVIKDSKNITNEAERKVIENQNKEHIQLFLQGASDRINNNNPNQIFYSLGVAFGDQLDQMNKYIASKIYGPNTTNQLNSQVILSSLTDYIMENPLLLDKYAAADLIKEKESKYEKSNQIKEREKYADKIARGEKFMKEIAKKPNMNILPSGIIYKIDKKGKGNIPTLMDRVTVHYTGRLTNGEVFDSSIERGEPSTFGVGQVIPGWTEVLQLMPVGSKWTVYIPYNRAYGENGVGSTIEPFSNLIFEIELIGIEK